jgi:hypothetical protein
VASRLSAKEMWAGLALVCRLPAFLRAPLQASEARDILAGRHRDRAESFLALARRAIYEWPASPYRRLLAHAGCERGDLVELVTRDGVEGALRALYRRGVYLTVEELRGRRPVVRGSTSFTVDPATLRNPTTAPQVANQSSGSRSAGLPVFTGLDAITEAAVDRLLTLDARGGRDWVLAYWDVPGGTLRSMLAYAKAGAVPTRWFSPVDPAAPDLHPRYRWSARAIRWGGRLAGVAFPAPEHVPVDRPLPIARWAIQVLRSGGTPCLLAYASPAVRLCQAARAAGLRLDGVQLGIYGEPVTASRLALIRAAGAAATPLYITTESGRTADACLAPLEADEVHLFGDLHALVQPGEGGAQAGLPSRALLLSSLRITTPLVLLNASMGDQAVATERRCGCPLEQLGWKTHLHTIRSYEKLTAGGMTFLDVDVIRVLDEELPARFGGGPTHYQVVEDRADDGRPRVRLLVDPAVGPVDTRAVATAFMAAIATGAGAERMMAGVWRDAHLLQVERRAPFRTASGKILHLHLDARETGYTAEP